MIRDARAVEFWVARYEFWMGRGMTFRSARDNADRELCDFAERFCEPEEKVAIEETLGRVGGGNKSDAGGA